MERKILLFNYFIEKVVQKEKELLNTEDEQVARMAIIFARVHMFRRYASGCTMENICFANPSFAADLFLLLCLKAEEKGDKIMQEFEFQTVLKNIGGNSIHTLEDKDLSGYIHNELYPVAKTINTKMYSILLNVPTDKVSEMFSKTPAFYIRDVNNQPLEQLRPGAQTEIIDRALDILWTDEMVKKSLYPTGKCDQYGCSQSFNLYYKRFQYLKERA